MQVFGLPLTVPEPVGRRRVFWSCPQSLNQIEKAYGPNNSILDNCHVRVSFATNDERTAKRALGAATEMKAMKNYAGSRHILADQEMTYAPRHGNGRLPLGPEGSLNESALDLLRQQKPFDRSCASNGFFYNLYRR